MKDKFYVIVFFSCFSDRHIAKQTNKQTNEALLYSADDNEFFQPQTGESHPRGELYYSLLSVTKVVREL